MKHYLQFVTLLILFTVATVVVTFDTIEIEVLQGTNTDLSMQVKALKDGCHE